MAGSEGILLTLLRHRSHARLEPHVVFFEDGPFRDEVEALGVSTSVVSPGRFREPWLLAAAIRRMAVLLRRTRPDVCISWLGRVQTVLAPAAAVSGLADRVVMWEHEVPDDPVPLHRVAVALPCAHVVADSHAGLEANRRLWPHRDGTAVWPGIDPPPVAPPADLAALRSELGLPDDRPVIGIIGRLVGWKGQDRLIEAVALMRDAGRDVSLLVVGGETHGVEAGIEQRLRALVADRGLSDRVWFCGHVPAPWSHLQLCDVFVNASVGEPFGLVLLEAMALEVPVVAVDRYGPAEILESDVSGVLVPHGTPAELAEAIGALVEDPQRRRRLAEAGRRRFEDVFTAERMAREIGRTLAGVADRPWADER